MTATINGTAYAHRGRLLVPANTVPDRPETLPDVPYATPAELAPEPVSSPVDGRPDDRQATPDETADRPQRSGREPDSAGQLWARLADEREVIAVRREDERERRAEDAQHRIALADVRERAATAGRARRERARDAEEAAELAELYRKATRAGARARIRADIQRSAEMRALRVAMVQRGALAVGLPVLAGFAAWSTTGVQAGMVRLLGIESYSAGWWAAWIVEPLLIAIVAGLIIVRAILRSSGGDTDRRADVAEWVALGMSIALNMLGGWSGQGGWSHTLGETLGHSVGAIGAAGTAWLIGVVTDYTSNAKPWHGAPRLADLNLTPPPAAAPGGVLPDAINRREHAPDTAGTDALPDDVRTLLDDVRKAITAGTVEPDPSGYAIYRRVMGGRGDKTRAYRVSQLVTGWRPLHAA